MAAEQFFPRPEIIIYDDAPEEARAQVLGLEERLNEAAPDQQAAHIDALKTLHVGTEAVKATLGYLARHPEGGAEVLSMWATVLEERLDLHFEFDAATEKAISSDPNFKAIDKSPTMKPEEKMLAKRRYRFTAWVTRRAQFASAA